MTLSESDGEIINEMHHKIKVFYKKPLVSPSY